MSVLNPTVTQKIIVTNNNGIFTGNKPTAVVKNEVKVITSLDDIPDVMEDAKVDGAVPQWNATLNKYEVKEFDPSFGEIDGGTF